MNPSTVTNKEIYEQRLPDGTLHGQVGLRDYRRFEDTLAQIDPAAGSLLDVGCGYGDWLNFVLARRRPAEHLGLDVAVNKIEEARRRFPQLRLEAKFAEELAARPGSFDVVTSLEVLEHIPDWQGVLQTLLRIARRQVVVTVPYRENIIQTVCVHCAHITPLYGHLHRFDEASFPQVEGWRLRCVPLQDRDPGRRLEIRIYRWLRPVYPWLLASYERTG